MLEYGILNVTFIWQWCSHIFIVGQTCFQQVQQEITTHSTLLAKYRHSSEISLPNVCLQAALIRRLSQNEKVYWSCRHSSRDLQCVLALPRGLNSLIVLWYRKIKIVILRKVFQWGRCMLDVHAMWAQSLLWDERRAIWYTMHIKTCPWVRQISFSIQFVISSPLISL